MGVLLCILDGVGLRDCSLGNAYKNANTKMLDYLWNKYPHCKLEASGRYVGLPDGQMGNSEVGHSTIGLGRVLYQSLELINNSINDGSFFENKELLSSIEHAKKNNSKLHLIGLLSDGGVHSHINHLFSLLDLCKKEKFFNVYIHIITDGRDTAPNSGIKYIKLLNKKINDLGFSSIATLCGRYYMMDRDNNYDRVKKAYDMLVEGLASKYDSVLDAWNSNQKNGITDEFMNPSIIDSAGLVNDNDSIITYNFRPDRLRELYSALSNKDFDCFDRNILNNLKITTMMPVDKNVICSNAFLLTKPVNSLGEVVSNNNLSQLRIAETEKYAHVTYFFDGGQEVNLKNCDKILIPSPKVSTYDLMPEMSAYLITDKLINLKNKKYDLIILNFANGDMVGHTGVYDAGVRAVEVVDSCIEEIYKNFKDEYTIIITADHGNCEQMLNDDLSINTAHTTNLVPFIVASDNYIINTNMGSLSDIAPTILSILDISIPKEITGNILVSKKDI